MQSRKEVISSVAARLFRKRGYSATTMRVIADEVGIKAASLYNHFGSKQEILQSLLMNMADLYTKGIKEISQTESSIIEKLEALVALHVDLTVAHTDASAMIASEWMHLENPTRSTYVQLREDYEIAFKQIIEQGKAQGVLQDLDTEVILFSLLSTLRWLYSWYSRHTEYDVEQLKSQLTKSLLKGIYRPT